MDGERGTNQFNLNKLLLVALFVILAITMIRTAWMGDDPYISFRTVDNFVNGHGLNWNPDERVQAFTHPLWVLLISIPYALTGEIYFTVLFLSMALAMIAVIIMSRKIAVSQIAALVAILVVLFSKAFIEYCTSGLENALSYLLLAIFCHLLFSHRESPRYFLWLCLVAALAATNRLDTILLYIPILVVTSLRLPFKKVYTSALIGFSPLLLWELFALLYYGFPFPNTFYAKLNTGIPKLDLIYQGLLYYLDSISHDPFTIIAIISILLWVIIAGSKRTRLLAAGVALYLVYIVYIGGDFMSGRFFALPLFLCAILLSRIIVACNNHQRIILPVAIMAVGFLSPHPPVLSDETFGTGEENKINQRGIADERGFYFQSRGMLSVSRQEYSVPIRNLDKLDSGKSTVIVNGFVGQKGYVSGPNLHIIDNLALGDPLLSRLPITPDSYWRIGHFLRVLPIGYEETVETGQEEFYDPDMAQYYTHLKTIISGDIWSWDRFKTIWKMNTGGYDYLLESYLHPRELILAEGRLDTPVPPGTAWNANGNWIIYPAGMKVILDSLHHENKLELSSDNNDKYVVQFLNTDEELLGEDTAVATFEPGMRWDTLDVPQNAKVVGYKVLRITPVEGDEMYSIGHVRLLEAGQEATQENVVKVADK